MSIPQLCLSRPVTVLMFYTGIVLFGLISLTFLRQELFPPITYPNLSVVTNYENAAPEEIETLITKPIEEAVGSTAGIKKITSTSREGLSVVVAEFGWDQKMDFAALGLREKIDLMKARLPRDAQEPTVIKFNPFELPVVTLSVSSQSRSALKLKAFTEKWFKDELEKINGVASATLSGGEDEEIRVAVDQGRLKASGIALNEVSKALSSSNLNYPGGTIKESFYEYLIRTMGEFKHLDEVGNVAISKKAESDRPQRPGVEAEQETEIILLKDIANIERTVKKRSSFSRFNGLENVTVSVQKQASANTIQVAGAIFKKLEELERHLPEDIQMEVIYNQADFIEDAINGVRDAAVQGGTLAFVVLLIFLRRVLTSTLVVVIAPITILATFTIMYFMGISLNVISLGGIALGVGMLVDSAIVVIENVFRRLKENPNSEFKLEVGKACEEVITPLFASTMTTIAVFLPMIFVTGIAGQIFKELALVVVFTQLISIVVAFTLLPVLITKFNSPSGFSDDEGKPEGWLNRILGVIAMPISWLQSAYERSLPGFLKHKGFFLLAVLGVFIMSIFALTKLEKVMMPKVDQGQFMLKMDMPVGTRVEVTNQISQIIERHLGQFDEIANISAVVGSSKGSSAKDVIQQIGSHQSQLIINLKPDREVSTDEFLQKVRKHLEDGRVKKELRGARLSYILYESAFAVGDAGGAPIAIHVSGNRMSILKRLAEDIQEGISVIPGVYDVSNTFPESSPETKVTINKDKASYYRMSVTDLATASHIAIKGVVATKFKEEGKEIPIRVVLQETDRDAVSKLPFIVMQSPLGVSVPLAELVHFKTGRGPSEIKRINQERTIQVFGKIYGRSLNDITKEVKASIADLKIPTGYNVDLGGASLAVQESFSSLRLALILSVILVYMIMAAQFESYFQPFIIMFTLPLALIGVASGLGISGTPVSVVVLLGVILLGGIVVNNGIILIDFINQLMISGKPLMEATMHASRTRFRPILMTALTTVLGLIPLAMGLSEGAKLQSPMAVTVMGGLTVATFLTLLVIPAIYVGTYAVRVFFTRNKKDKDASLQETKDNESLRSAAGGEAIS
jgi:hydrophobic/amphiphilic exporter-1 (mainly G- bacteria), HAE1 family